MSAPFVRASVGVFGWTLLLAGCNAIFGIEPGEPAPDEAGAGGTSSGGASGSDQGGTGDTGTGGANGGSGGATSGGRGGEAATGGTASGGRNTGGTDAVGGMAATGGTDAVGGMAATGGTDAVGGMAATAGTTGGGTGGSVGGMAGTGTGGMAGAIGSVHYDFEGAGNLDGFEENMDCPTLSISQSSEQHAGTTGSGSMKITLTGPLMGCEALYVRRASPLMVLPGQTISFQAYFPPTSAGTFGWFDLIVEDGDYMWTIYEVPIPTARSTWVTVTYPVPSDLLPPVRAIGFDMAVDPGFNGSVYVDQIAW